MVTLIVVICLGAGCVEEPVDYLPVTACSGMTGMMTAMRYVESHPLYGEGEWRLAGWRCQPGPPVQRRQADLHAPDNDQCIPTIRRVCLWHRTSQQHICVNTKVDCKSELTSG